MLVDALNQYYNCLCERENSPLLPKGYSKVLISYNIILTQDGKLKAIAPHTKPINKKTYKKEEKKWGYESVNVSKEEIFPFRNSISGIVAETIEHREKYLFGVEWDDSNEKFILGKSSQEAFEKQKKRFLEFTQDIAEASNIINAFKLFLDSWVPEEQLQSEILSSLGKNFNKATFVISLEGENGFLHTDEIIKKTWEDYLKNKVNADIIKGQCSISGENDVEIARLHNKIKGINGGQSSGTTLVSFNNSSFESYNQTQSYNSHISQEIMKNYTTALNYLTSSKNSEDDGFKHKQVIGNMTLLFWAMTSQDDTAINNQLAKSIGIGNVKNYDEAKAVEDDYSKLEQEILVSSGDESLQSASKNLEKGIASDIEGFENYKDIDFYIVGITPNNSRLSVNFFYRQPFGKMLENLNKHNLDMQFKSDDKQIPIWAIIKELKSPKSDKNIPTALSTKLLQSILNNKPYPRALFTTIICRVKTDQDDSKNKFQSVNRRRVRIIKGILTRLNKINKEDYSMLNTENKESSYNCGRLFAILEIIQKNASNDRSNTKKNTSSEGLNASIKDKFFSSACDTPYLVFPRLIKLSQKHLAKMSESSKIYYDKLILEIMSNLTQSFPKTLNLEEQGMFILGYYQQKAKIYKVDENNNNNNNDIEKGED